MKTKLIKLLTGLVGSFKMTENANDFSARKLTAFAIVLLVSVMQVNYLIHCYKTGKYDLLVELTITDFGFAATLFGLTTFDPRRDKKSNVDQP